jgi:tyrosine-protein kinase Etk/Wzc
LANTMAQTGVRVLVVDCDLRRSSLHEKFGVSKVPGLTEVLTGDTTFREVLHDAVIPGVDLISAGTTPPNPAELLGSEEMRQFLVAHREDYDHIFIDAPPVLAVTDAPVLTSLSDIVLVVMEAGRVPVKAAHYMREMLANTQAPVAGFVMNDKTGRGETYGYYGSRYYRYGGYGRKYGHGYGYGYGHGYYSDDESKPRGKPPFWKRFLPSRKHRQR